MKTKEINNILHLSDSTITDCFLKQGILIFYKKRNPIALWSNSILRANYYDRKMLEDAICSVVCDNWKGFHFSPESDILAIDIDGNVLLKNFDVSVQKDKYGFIHIYEPQTNNYNLVKTYPLKQKPESYIYFIANDLSKLNSRIKSAVEKKLIEKPKDFSLRTGLKIMPIFQTSEQSEPT